MMLQDFVKRINHLGSGALLLTSLLLALILVLPIFGIEVNWKPQTTPYRLVHQAFVAWSLLIILWGGLILIRLGSMPLQCVSCFIFVCVIFGIAIVSALLWDAWLSPMLVFSTLPMKFAAVQAFQQLLESRQQA